MATPHNAAQMGDIAKTVLMPGDPLRAKFIAENYLTEVNCYNTVRNMFGFTGLYEGKKVSVQGSGMGIPSIGIYSYELFSMYGVESIIRIGSAGAIREDLKLGSVVAAMGACTTSNFAHQYELPGTFAPIADYDLLRKSDDNARQLGINLTVGNLLSNDVFYNDVNRTADWVKMGVLAVEMEAAGLYMTAARLGKKALCLCTISDNIITGEEMSAGERQNTFHDMMKLALSLA